MGLSLLIDSSTHKEYRFMESIILDKEETKKLIEALQHLLKSKEGVRVPIKKRKSVQYHEVIEHV
jgi:hypothetical protein